MTELRKKRVSQFLQGHLGRKCESGHVSLGGLSSDLTRQRAIWYLEVTVSKRAAVERGLACSVYPDILRLCHVTGKWSFKLYEVQRKHMSTGYRVFWKTLPTMPSPSLLWIYGCLFKPLRSTAKLWQTVQVLQELEERIFFHYMLGAGL